MSNTKSHNKQIFFNKKLPLIIGQFVGLKVEKSPRLEERVAKSRGSTDSVFNISTQDFFLQLSTNGNA